MKRALVTGGSGDLGSAICRLLAQDGHYVVVHANRRRERAEALVERIRGEGGRAETAVFDVCAGEQTARVLAAILDGGPIQILVNNAGIHADAPLAGMRAIQWQSVIDVTLNGFFNVTQPLLLPMMSTRWGRIINISSVSGVLGNRGQANYAAAKAGLHGAAKSLAREVGSRGITVNTVAPGIIAGRMTDSTFDADAIKRLVPMKRAGLPEEVASVVGFLASPMAAYVSGQIIGVDGAMT